MPPKLRSGADGVADAGFTEDDRAVLNGVLGYIKKLTTKLVSVQGILKQSKEIIENQNAVILQQNKTINDLACHVNCTNYRADAHQQYNRRESIRGLELEGLGDDPVKIVMDVCKFVEDTAPPYKGNKVCINLQPGDIHRCHFLGTGAKKKLICKFTPSAYHKKMKLMLNKSHINQVSSGKFKDFFIVEDLTPMRSHLLWYAKKNFAHKFHKFHTRNGVIKCKDKSDVSNDGKWKSMENPDDLHALVGDEFDPEHFNHKDSNPPVKIFTTLPVPDLYEFVIDDDDENDVLPLLPEKV